VGILPIIHQSFSCSSTTTIIHNAHAPPPRRHLHLSDTATHNAHHPPHWLPTTIMRRPMWQCHVTNQTNGHIDARQQRQEPELPHRSRRHGRQTMDNDEVSPPPPYCLLTPEPGAYQPPTNDEHGPPRPPTNGEHSPPRPHTNGKHDPPPPPTNGDDGPTPAPTRRTPPHERRTPPTTSHHL